MLLQKKRGIKKYPKGYACYRYMHSIEILNFDFVYFDLKKINSIFEKLFKRFYMHAATFWICKTNDHIHYQLD